MLSLRPSCECCDKDLPPESAAAMICSFECTFCADCASQKLAGHCPNCGGELLRRQSIVVAQLRNQQGAVFRPVDHAVLVGNTP